MEPARQIGKIIVRQNAGNHAGKLSAIDTALDDVGPGDQRALEDDMLDQPLLIEHRSMQDRQPGRSDSRNVKTRGCGRSFPGLQALEQADPDGNSPEVQIKLVDPRKEISPAKWSVILGLLTRLYIWPL